MPKRIQKFSRQQREHYAGQHRFEHWYVSNQVYFITARCRDCYPAFASESAKTIFWGRLLHHTQQAGFEPWIVSLIDNHYHLLGYCPRGETIKTMMPRIHGSVAKLVNDLLPQRRTPFWRNALGHDYFDGCIRDEMQLRRAYRYTLIQSVRHGIVADRRLYPHTRVWKDLEDCLAFARAHKAYMEDIPYPRYQRGT